MRHHLHRQKHDLMEPHKLPEWVYDIYYHTTEIKALILVIGYDSMMEHDYIAKNNMEEARVGEYLEQQQSRAMPVKHSGETNA